MGNNTVLNQEFGSEQILKVTALLYLKEALITQQYETCPELIEAAKNYGADQNDISAVIADYLKLNGPSRQSRIRS